MSSVSPTDAAATRERRRTMNQITDTFREMSVVMTVLNLRAGEQVGLRDVEMKALDVLMRDGAMSAKALGQRLGMHPATMTGILDKLEKSGWVVRERSPEDRRVVLIQPVRERVGEVVRLFAGMNGTAIELLDRYDTEQLETILGFMNTMVDMAKQASKQWGE
ncbi:transcriptional regulator, MarR family [Catenulispora acidiphila DSM 44928]|uniref:Transcriptional regulator, MarR family n=1 Tax=Catenulispora acidiphila (strain DSM 44928 / JCM 14897 / NBRC 102108 / NRRL B-24433 / ID139908) TaxID=479433 RepID=C7QBB1_CATAD|nr:MarR family transcriptional regulator [Catenulispora acidiphila]ACU76402.1 transcriptional regulator, MarR family [Catenulispora acidiphila DSM 44928]